MMVRQRSKTNKITTSFFAITASVSVFFFTGIASAEGSFLLQLGTFESYTEATKKWEEVKLSNRDIVGKLDGKIAEVMLPSDIAPSFRTQAGPVETRREARDLCKQLQERNINCLIVETAFAATDLAPEMAGETAPSPNVSSQAAPTPPAAATPLRATNEEEQITSSNIAPVEPQSTPATSVQAVNTLSQSVPEMPDTVIIEGTKAEEKPIEIARVPEPKSTTLVSESSKNENEYYNPNDVKKSGFFRGTFRFNGNRPYSEENKTASAPAEKQVVEKSTSDESDDNKPSFFGRLFGSSSEDDDKKPKETLNPNLKADVEVAEAIRVPLSPVNEPQIETSSETLLADTTTTVNQQAQPVAPIKQAPHMYWAQINYFQTENIAYAFNEHLKKFLPEEMKNVRARVTRPFGDKNKKSSLRVGAFYSQQNVVAVCGEARSQGFRCTTIRDVVTDVPNIATSRTAKRKYLSPLDAVEIPAYQPPARKSSMASQAIQVDETAITPQVSANSTLSDAGIAGQWVELGAFVSTQEAWNHWKMLQEAVVELRTARSAISGTLSGNGSSKYQLRAGAFATDVEAEAACKAVVKQGNNCFVASPF